MDTLFLALKKLLVGTIFVVFAFVMVYVPQAPTSQVETVEALSSGSIVFDPRNTLQNSWSTAQETISAAAESLGWGKSISLDGIAWSLAKRAIGMMATEFLNWVNSGFQGRPAFVTDLRGFLTDVADQEFGQFISELGDIGSFICAPFRLDVQVAVAVQYQESRTGINGEFGGANAPTCTLSGVIDNIQGFIDGTDPGRGLADWLTITATPQTYTPYGAVLSAQAAGRARLINAQGEELQLLEFGGGFLSQSVCEIIEGTNQENCTITTPGVTIAGQLNKVLGAGQDILVEADEINEYIGQLLGALANQAFIGAAGLLGLSGNTGQSYGGYDGSYLDALNQQNLDSSGNITGSAADSLADALRSERNYRSESQYLLDLLTEFIVDAENPQGARNIATILNEEIADEIFTSNANITALTNLLAEFDNATTDRQIEIFIEYSNLDITNEVRKVQNLDDWREQMTIIGIDPTDTRGIDAIIERQSTSTATTTETTGNQ